MTLFVMRAILIVNRLVFIRLVAKIYLPMMGLMSAVLACPGGALTFMMMTCDVQT